ncbi:3-hydroxypropanoate dehydrogenase [Nocardioides albertanoniae]|uniref:3-hydroxypropanoate dehydrogenase n=1 Tax=Nocardioides albertanoniae TaxID=1175486 RepID=A0A543ABS5_9ACTN|nr:malonic semialdehyde reductase [Nocardioides albertanoniae]TQL69936.1 3-hydroxypropanoate dehydrogenase [Nocardioides albertanoniae]
MTETNTLAKLDPRGRELVFTAARTSNTFAETPVTDEELADIWELTRWTPTMANTQPLRVVFVRTAEGKERLLPHIAEGNLAKTEAAPATAIVAYDNNWHEEIPNVFPIRPEMKDYFASDETARHGAGGWSAGLQAGAFILAVRAAGLAAGPIAGYDTAGVDKEFFPEGDWTTKMIVNIGHPGENPWFDRLPRVEADTAVKWA